MKLYQYPNCGTCRKASKYLTQRGLAYESINIVEQPPTKIELRIMLASYDGELRKLFNTSGIQYRELNMKEKLPNMSDDQAIELLSGNGKLIKRPFLLDGDRGIVAFKEELWAEFI
jgi:arsenate reductase